MPLRPARVLANAPFERYLNERYSSKHRVAQVEKKKNIQSCSYKAALVKVRDSVGGAAGTDPSIGECHSWALIGAPAC